MGRLAVYLWHTCDGPGLARPSAGVSARAIDILGRRADDEPVHYRTWYEWVRHEGYLVAGKDPLASFLGAVSRLDCVERVGGPRSGRYRLHSQV